jgi:hypothetical protein
MLRKQQVDVVFSQMIAIAGNTIPIPAATPMGIAITLTKMMETALGGHGI